MMFVRDTRTTAISCTQEHRHFGSRLTIEAPTAVECVATLFVSECKGERDVSTRSFEAGAANSESGPRTKLALRAKLHPLRRGGIEV
jgi:hypothetical protein